MSKRELVEYSWDERTGRASLTYLNDDVLRTVERDEPASPKMKGWTDEYAEQVLGALARRDGVRWALREHRAKLQLNERERRAPFNTATGHAPAEQARHTRRKSAIDCRAPK